jgi:hypothetical protein
VVEYTIPLVSHGGSIATVAQGIGTRIGNVKEEINSEQDNLVYYVGPYTNSGTEPVGKDSSQLLIVVHDRLGGLYMVDLMKGGEKVKILSQHKATEPNENQKEERKDFRVEAHSRKVNA